MFEMLVRHSLGCRNQKLMADSSESSNDQDAQKNGDIRQST